MKRDDKKEAEKSEVFVGGCCTPKDGFAPKVPNPTDIRSKMATLGAERLLNGFSVIAASFKRFLFWDNFPLALAVILLFTTKLDIEMTYHVFINYPDLFYEFELNPLARLFFGTDKWWINPIVYALGDMFVVWTAYLFKPQKYRMFSDLSCLMIRIICLFSSISPLIFGVFGWWLRLA